MNHKWFIWLLKSYDSSVWATKGYIYLPVQTQLTCLHTHTSRQSQFFFSSLQRGEIEFEVVYVAPEVDSDDENVEYEDDSGHRYRLYLDELEEASGAGHNNGTADPASLQGKCIKLINRFVQHLLICVNL